VHGLKNVKKKLLDMYYILHLLMSAGIEVELRPKGYRKAAVRNK
jgi:hypothetical protein